VKVLVVDDHPLVRDAMSGILAGLSSALEIIEASDCAGGLAFARTHPDIDLVLLDLELPGSRRFEALERFRREHPTLPVVILSMHRDRQAVRGAIERGAMGFIPKASPKEVIASAVRLVLAGGVYLPPEALAEEGAGVAAAVEFALPADASRSLSGLGLTPRQGQVLALIMQGKSNKEICRELGLADRTVKVHVTAVLTALRVPSRTKAVVAAGRLGLNTDSLLAADLESDS
jgi:DNA-binding NarL/FixJ family response regulator